MKLKVDDLILVHGYVMLKGLEGGQKYKVKSVQEVHNMPTYKFTKARGKKVVAHHYAGNVDHSINDRNDLNRIEKL